jgi:hypothetical protein
VRHEGDVLPWIRGAKAVIHNSCTTGIESALIGTPVISYRPIVNKEYDHELPNTVSKEVFDYEDLYKTISGIDKSADNYEMNKKQKATLRQYFYNIDDYAAPKVSSIINKISNNNLMTAKYSERPAVKQQIKQIMTFIFGIRTTEKILQNLTDRDYDYMRQKFPGLSSKEIHREVQNISGHAQVPSVSITRRRSLGDVFIMSKG